MTDPSNVGALSAKMLSVGVQVCENLLTYYSVFDRRVVEQLMVELEALSTDIRNVIHRVGSERFQSTEHTVVLAFRHPIQQCEETIADLRDESEKIIAVPTNSAWNSADMSGYQRIYPLRPSTLLRLEEDIASIRNHMSSALQALQLEEYPKAAHGGAMSLDSLIRTYKCEPYFSHIIDYTTIYAKRHAQSGLWFTTGPYFTKWLTQKNSFIWLSGRAGSGKSVLCSTAAHYTFHTTRGEPNVAFGIFFFKFDESMKQDASAMMRSSLLQLAGQCQDCQTDLTGLHASCQPGPPATERSFEYLRRMIRRFRSVYIFVDGLDEIRSNEKRKGVLTAVRRMREWCLSALHLLVTSRDEPAIREILNPSSGEEVAIESSGMRSDISDFFSFKLHTHTSLRKWKTYHDQIQQRLSEHAQGGFRYIECQLEVIKQCPRTASHLYTCLQSLPRDLDEAYDRMLSSNEVYAHNARRIVSLLSFSNRPLKVAEVADAYAIDLDKRHFNPEDRLLDIASIKEICGGLVEISVKKDEKKGGQADSVARISHFSVQEYLESDRILQRRKISFALQSENGHAALSQVCIIYLLEIKTDEMKHDEISTEYPLAHYAAESWYTHYEKAANMRSHLDPLVLELFKDSNGSFRRWISLCEVDKQPGHRRHENLTSSGTATPLYLASFLGLSWLFEYILTDDREDDTRMESLVNEQCGYFGNALQAASYNGHKDVVKKLLKKGADPNRQGGHFGSALQAASYNGHESVVQILLDHEIDIDMQGGEFGNALLAASYNGHAGVLKMLLSRGANCNVHLDPIGNPLRVASWRGHASVVQALLENGGLSVNPSGVQFENALQEASYHGHRDIVRILLDGGAKVNAQGGRFGYPLQAASFRGQEEIVLMLLDTDADINAVGGRYGSALQAASLGGYERIVRILLERCADANIQYGLLGNALQAASWKGHRNVVQMLLDNGARVNTLGGLYGCALQAASLKGHEDIVQILLDNGADPNTLGGEYGNSLVAASYNGNAKIVQMLLHRGADATAQVDGSIASNALQAATMRNHKIVMRLLLDAGAEL